MVKTQIQLPDELYREAKRVAAEREMSLAEVFRRGLEAILCQFPNRPAEGEWKLPEARPLGGDDFFSNPDWRLLANQPDLMLREKPARYSAKRGKRKP